MSGILTHSGITFRFDFIEQRSISILDIGHHLAQINRFAGACVRPYSVAEHSLLVAYIMETHLGVRSPHALMAGLLHDGHEAYVGDMSSPLKTEVGEHWHRVEGRAQHAVMCRFDCAAAYASSRHLIRRADLIALITERHGLLPPGGPDWPAEADHPPIEWDFKARERNTWDDWRRTFLERFAELQHARTLPLIAAHPAA